MSDEPEPPALRLRPRNKSKSEEPASDVSKTSPAAEDSSTTPSLRLKPKLKQSEAAAEASAEPEAATPPATEPTPTEAPKVRSKPRLAASPEDEVEPSSEVSKKDVTDSTPPPSAEVEPAPASEQTPRKSGLSLKSLDGADSAATPSPTADSSPSTPPSESPDDASAAPLPAAPAAKPRLQLSWANQKGPAEGETVDSAVEPPKEKAQPISMSRPPIVVESESTSDAAGSALPPPLPIVTEAGDPSPDYPAPPGVSSGTDENDEDDDDVVPRKRRKRPEQSLVFKIAIAAIMLLVVGLVVGGAYFAYTTLFGGANEPTPVAVTPPPAEPAAADPQSLAGKLVEKAQNAAAAHDEITAEVEALTEPEPSPVVIDESEAGDMAAQANTPSLEFQKWVGEARINSVREGRPARAFINSILVEQGDVVNPQMGIVFSGINPDQNLLIFEDASGAVVGKKY